MTLQTRTKNPMNIRFSPKNNWVGQVGEFKGFCIFKSESYCFRAAYILITNYIKQGYNTIESIINRYAPPCENNTENYINFVCEDTLIDRDQKLYTQSIHDYWTTIMIIRAMAKMECGRWYDEQFINLNINYPDKY